tara:strand:- start:1794 stop:3929 length:2136 start_codon:yes stop_codon:yes gene_type:complete
MAVTPLLKPIQNKKGILYTFQSALEDINITLANSENSVRYSKFACLRIPEFGVPNTLASDNKFQFLAQGESFINNGVTTADPNIDLAQSFQSYALNMEALLISKPSYSREEKLTVAEKVFWKWLKESGGIRFRNANGLEQNVISLGTDVRFVEPHAPTNTYNRVVQYVGDIDVVNTVKSNDNSYTEVYMYIPTNVGTTPHVLFKSGRDQSDPIELNYLSNDTISNNPESPLDIEYLSGRHYNDTHPFGLSIKAYYDLDDGSVTSNVAPGISGTPVPGNWFDPHTIKNAYFTDSDFTAQGTYSIPTTTDELITKVKGATSVQYLRSTLDGITLDFNLENYKLASENPEIKVFSQFSDYVGCKDFQYNAILIYYDTYDPNNLDSDGNPIDISTNLYGILFLDKVEQDGLEFSIPMITKYRPDVLNKVNGNSFGFKANLKLDTSIENVLVEKSINDFSTFSMDLFTDVLTEFKKIQSSLNDKLLDLTTIRNEVEVLKDLLINTEDLNEYKIRLDNVEKSLLSNSAIFNNTNEIVKMIENTNEKVDDILNGNSNITISYDASVIKPGNGIRLDNRTTNRIKIENSNQDYNISNTSIADIFTNDTIKLSTFSNYVRHETASVPTILIKDHDIFIDDSINSWKKGQTVKIVFDDELILDIYNVRIKTDSLNKLNTGIYNKQIAIFDSVDFLPSNNKPIFEIICINDETLEFRVDKIR